MQADPPANASEPREPRARLRRPSRRTARRAATGSLLAAVVACALLLWPGFLRGGTAYVIVSGESMEPALEAGDLVVTVRKRGYDVGDVIAYRIPDGEPGAGVLVIHRIVGGSAGAGYITQGDNREGRDPWRPRPHDVVGTEAVTVPRVGQGLAHVRTPLGLAVLAGVVTGLLVLGGSNTTGRSEHAGAKESPPARLRRRRRHERADDVDDVPPPGSPAGDSAAPEIPAAAATGREEGETRALAGAVATVALLVAVTVVTHRRLRLVE